MITTVVHMHATAPPPAAILLLGLLDGSLKRARGDPPQRAAGGQIAISRQHAGPGRILVAIPAM
jgi:hypothetical protein